MEPIDERNAEIAALKAALESFSKMAKELKKERDKAAEDATNYYARLGEVEKERDEAIADRDILRIDAQKEDAHHDRLLNELDKVYKERDDAREERDIARLERDEAIADYQRVYKARDEANAQVKIIKPNENNPVAEYFSSSNTPETDKFKIKFKTSCGEKYWVPVEHSERLERERDEAREAIVGWENKWKCAIEMAAKAEVERDEARDLAQQMSESNQVLMADVRFYRKAFEDTK